MFTAPMLTDTTTAAARRTAVMMSNRRFLAEETSYTPLRRSMDASSAFLSETSCSVGSTIPQAVGNWVMM